MRVALGRRRDQPGLARAQTLVGLEAPNAFQQPLAAQNLVATGDDSAVAVRHVEHGGVHLRHLRVQRQQFGRDRRAGDGAAPRVQLHRGARPDRPMAEQAPDDA
jgi:hypothetical protein